MNAQSSLATSILERLFEAGHSQLITSVQNAVIHGRGFYRLDGVNIVSLSGTAKSIGNHGPSIVPQSFLMTNDTTTGKQSSPVKPSSTTSTSWKPSCMQAQLKRLDRVIQQLAMARNEIARNPELELDLERLLTIVEVSSTALADEVEEELK